MAAMKDKEFLAEAEKAQIDIQPMTGEETAALIASIASVPANVVERATKAQARE
jgi:hypothetical protein